jgi:serine/threonine protein phosphatase PrpC
MELSIKAISHTFHDPSIKIIQNLFWPEPDPLGNIAYPVDSNLLLSRGRLFVVAAGTGIPPSGIEVCELGIKTLIEKFYDTTAFSDVPSQLYIAFQATNQVVYDYIQTNLEKHVIGISMVAAVMRENELTVASVGETGAYLIKREVVEELTPINQLPRPIPPSLLRPLLGSHRASLPVITAIADSLPVAKPYMDIIKEKPIALDDIVILASDFSEKLSRLKEPELLDKVKVAADDTVSQRLVEASPAWNDLGIRKLTTTIIWFT